MMEKEKDGVKQEINKESERYQSTCFVIKRYILLKGMCQYMRAKFRNVTKN